MNSQTLEQLCELLASETGHNVDEILPLTQLEVDLGVSQDEDFPRLLASVNQEFGVELKLSHVLSELNEAGDTVEHLSKLIEEEIELG